MKIIIRESGDPYGFVRADDDIKTVQIDVMRSPEIPPGFPSSDIAVQLWWVAPLVDE